MTSMSLVAEMSLAIEQRSDVKVEEALTIVVDNVSSEEAIVKISADSFFKLLRTTTFPLELTRLLILSSLDGEVLTT